MESIHFDEKLKYKFFLVLVIFGPLLLFYGGLTNFFFADDWFHLKLGQITSTTEFINFFSFTKSAQFAGSYRPLSTQTFFFLFQTLFGLNQVPYHLFVFIVFSLNLFLLYRVSLVLFQNTKLSLIAVFIYGVSATNFTRLYFLSAFQEILIVFFILGSVLAYLRSKFKLSVLLFICSLMSKETAIVLPGILLLVDWYRKNINKKQLTTFIAITSVYILLRFVLIGGVEGESYIWDFSVKKIFNNFFWYSVWSLGTPEFLLDYVGSGLKVIPRFYSDFSAWAYPILLISSSAFVCFTFLVVTKIKSTWRAVVLGSGIFAGALLPVVFLPWHKFSLELGIPMLGFSLMTASLLVKKSKLAYIFVSVFLLTNISTVFLLTKLHYSVNQSKLSEKVFNYFSTNYPIPPDKMYFEFVNDTPDLGFQWGSSKQISQAISGSNMFKVIYRNHDYDVYFADYFGQRPANKTKIPISTKMFTE